MMIRVYGFGKVAPQVMGITRDLRVLWALEECELEYEVNGLDDFAGELHSAEYLAIHPFGKVPAIDHDGFILFESGAIVVYLAEHSGQLQPTSESKRVEALQWAFATLDTIEPSMTEIAVIDLFQSDADWAKLRRPMVVEMARDRLRVLSSILSGKDYLLGKFFTYPDILLASALCELQHTDILEGHPTVSDYLERCLARPAWQKCLSEYKHRLTGEGTGF